MTDEYPKTCTFCRIVQGEAPSHIVYAHESVLAVLDINPIRQGHIQILPRVHVPYFDDLPTDLAATIIGVGQRLAKALKRIEGVQRVAFCFSGSDIPHAHAHLVPLHASTDITSRRYIVEDRITFRPTPRAPDEELAAVAARVRAELSS